jgi:hypothetical protein
VKKYIVELTQGEREYLYRLISAGSAPARMLNRARILLKADAGEHVEEEPPIDRHIAPMLETSTATVQRVRERFLGRGSMRRSNARRPIGSTRGPSMVGRKPA